MAFFRKARVRRRVRKALKKYVRGNPKSRRARRAIARYKAGTGRAHGGPGTKALREKYLQYVQGNPSPVKGRKVKGGRAVTVRNFTGTIVKKSDGTVQIVGKGRRK